MQILRFDSLCLFTAVPSCSTADPGTAIQIKQEVKDDYHEDELSSEPSEGKSI